MVRLYHAHDTAWAPSLCCRASGSRTLRVCGDEQPAKAMLYMALRSPDRIAAAIGEVLARPGFQRLLQPDALARRAAWVQGLADAAPPPPATTAAEKTQYACQARAALLDRSAYTHAVLTAWTMLRPGLCTMADACRTRCGTANNGQRQRRRSGESSGRPACLGRRGTTTPLTCTLIDRFTCGGCAAILTEPCAACLRCLRWGQSAGETSDGGAGETRPCRAGRRCALAARLR